MPFVERDEVFDLDKTCHSVVNDLQNQNLSVPPHKVRDTILSFFVDGQPPKVTGYIDILTAREFTDPLFSTRSSQMPEQQVQTSTASRPRRFLNSLFSRLRPTHPLQPVQVSTSESEG